ncbi:MAG: ABC-F family ATP-binding cassette domain-containing protein [Chloroflexota bacterium]
MSILSFSNLAQSFGAFDLFYGISGSLARGDKVGIVGPNGVGKTTLLHILVGNEKSSDGSLHLAKGTRIGYLRQEAMLAFKGREQFTVEQEMERVFAPLHAMLAELNRLEEEMASGDETILEQYSNLQIEYERAGGYDYQQRIKRVLDGLGFQPDNWQTPLEQLSGGQKTRALLGRLLLEEPELLILDEPTNHLDIEAVEWLEGMLNTWDGAVLIVSHDRYFLDRVAKTIFDMSADLLEIYRGNYSAYLTQRAERWERRQKELEAEQARLEKEMDYIRKNIAGQRTSQAKGKLKRLNATLGLGKGALKLWRTEDTLKAFTSQKLNPNAKGFNLDLKSGNRSGNIVLRTTDLVVGYPTKSLFSADDIELTRLEVAALIGPNGSGKTTFLKTILEDHPALTGQVKLGAALKIGYFSQAHDSLKLENTILEELLRHQHMLISEARSYLGQFLFSGDDVEKKVSTLSGGERGRLALAILALQDANFLLLDEPTNHLDIQAQELLQTVLERFDGTVLMVSHDRYLIDRLATQIWAIRDQHLNVTDGSYQTYLAVREAEKVAQAEAKAEARETQPQRSQPSENGEKPKRSKNEQRRLERALETVEHSIEEAETHLATVTDALQAASEAQDFDKIQQVTVEYETAQKHLDELMDEWEKLSEII